MIYPISIKNILVEFFIGKLNKLFSLVQIKVVMNIVLSFYREIYATNEMKPFIIIILQCSIQKIQLYKNLAHPPNLHYAALHSNEVVHA